MDIPALVQRFINLEAWKLKLPAIPTLSPGAIQPLMTYHWPGNVRELENVIEWAIIHNPTVPLVFEHLNPGQPRKTFFAEIQYEEIATFDEVIIRHIRSV